MGITRERRSGPVLIFATALVLALAAMALGAGPGSAATAGDYHVVTFKDEPVVAYDGGVGDYRATTPERGQGFDAHSPASEEYAGHLRGVHGDYIRWLQQRAPEVEVVRDLVYAANAIAVKLNGADPQLLSQGPGVKYSTPSDLYRPTMNTSVQLIDVPWLDGSEEERANAGAGVKVAVIDSGIDSSHPFIGSCRDGGNEVSHQVFVSGDTTGAAEGVLYGTPDDADLVFDHGTHVAGTIGGCVTPGSESLAGITLLPGSLEDMSGVAPGVELHDYNVFPGYGAGYIAYGGSAFSHDIGAAIEQALLDGMDVVNMSLGGGVQGPHDWLAEVVNDASRAMVFSVSAGNSGNGGNGDYATIGSPGTAAGAITVGASTNDRSIAYPIVVDGAPYPAAVGDFHPLDLPDAESMVEWPEADTTACTLTDASLAGLVVLIDRGGCTFSTKVENAEAAGAIGVVVANNIPGDGPIAMAASGPIPETPAVGVSYEAGQAIRDVAEPWTVTADPTALREFEEAENQIATFSSRGPTAFTHLIKPDVVAPGVNIRSSVFEGEYAQFQGTSMAAPHVAGAAALVIEALGTWTPRQVKGLLVAAAERVDPLASESALARGNGLVDVADAVQRTAWADPVSISFGVHTGGSPISAAVELELSDGCGVKEINRVPSGVTVGYDGEAVTLEAGRTASGSHEGDIVVECGGGETFAVPWWFEIDRRGS